MALWTWWPGDQLPPVRGLDGFNVDRRASVDELGLFTGLSADEIDKRIRNANTCYLGRLDEAPVAYGWVATSVADIGELEVSFQLDGRNRYLWDFQTLPDWRGRGIYPLLLQAILAEEGMDDHQFWIITAPENRASARGIEKAGFTPAAQLAFTDEGRAGLVAIDWREQRVLAGAAVLGVPSSQPTEGDALSPCWCCIIDVVEQSAPAACWGPSRSGAQTCDC